MCLKLAILHSNCNVISITQIHLLLVFFPYLSKLKAMNIYFSTFLCVLGF